MNHENDNPIDPDISDLYQSTRDEGPGAALDAAILAQAEAAVAPKRKRPAWIAPVGLAATVLLGVNLAVNLKDYSNDPDIYSEAARPSAQNAIKVEPRHAESSVDTTEVDVPVEPINLPRFPLPDIRTSVERLADDESDVIPMPAPQAQADSGTSPVTSNADNPTLGASQFGQAEPKDRDDPDDRALAAKRQMRAREPLEIEQRRERQSESATLASQSEREPARPTSEDPARTEPEFPPAGITAAAVVAAPAEPAQESAGMNPQSAPAITSLELRIDADSDITLLPATPSKMEEQASEDTGLEEVVVTGSKIDRLDDSPHRRLNAKDLVLRNEQRELDSRINSTRESDNYVSSALASRSPTYACDLDALRISEDAIESAKVEARNFEPPLNAVSWPQYIRVIAANGDYVSACVQLAAYRQIFPDVALIRPLPVTLPTRD